MTARRRLEGAAAEVRALALDRGRNALGYSGTNSGGTIVIENSQFDGNQDGLDTNTAVIGDPPAPQDGRCPDGGVSPVTRTLSCWVLIHNYIHDNNSATVPAAGSAAAGPIGTRLDDLRRPLRHGHGQHDREQRRVGRAVRPLRPPPRPPAPWP